jgi:DNA replication protein DnaC
MLTHPIIEKLTTLRLTAMARTLEEQMKMPDAGTLSFEERLGLMVDREMTERESRSLQRRLRKAHLRERACMEDIDYRSSRGLNRSLMKSLASCAWLASHENVLITGPTGVGKTWIACALGHRACMEGYSVLYRRMPALLRELLAAKNDGSYGKLIAGAAKTDLVVLDDWGLERLNHEQSLDLLEILEDRYGVRSTLVAAQIPADKWHETVSDPTLADAIMDRLIHNAHRIELKGGSLRMKNPALTGTKEKE